MKIGICVSNQSFRLTVGPVRYAAFHFLWFLDFLSMFSYKIGEAFLHMPQSRALNRLERDQMSIDGKVATLALQADECEVQMKGLKVVLYAKFGKAIN